MCAIARIELVAQRFDMALHRPDRHVERARDFLGRMAIGDEDEDRLILFRKLLNENGSALALGVLFFSDAALRRREWRLAEHRITYMPVKARPIS